MWREYINKLIEEAPVISLISPKNYLKLIQAILEISNSENIPRLILEYLAFAGISEK